MYDYKLLEALAAVIGEGGFERAARRLSITQSAVSQRIRQLEEAAGQPVLARTQPPAPTAAGRKLLRHVRRVGLLEAELARDLESHAHTGAEPWRTLAVAVNADTLATWFIGAVLPVLLAERLALDIRVDDQERTHEFLRAGEVAGCVSTRQVPMQGCRAIPLGVMRYHCCAAPGFAARWFPAGLDLAAARGAPAVVFNRQDAVHDRFLEIFLGESPQDAPRHHVPNSERFVDVVLAGAGYGLIPHVQAAEHLERGALMDLAPRAPMPVPLYWHCWNIPSPLLARLTRALREAGGRVLQPYEGPTA
ncbi:MAG: LysR family transcriptional regulator ArgP [Desulfovibrio sp.]|jgi:LysR family transcriptional regulator (chromosome initiation inhibitor)|nr:LysR family transcriptional regulator ArgP [Desulfovibrio sp.]